MSTGIDKELIEAYTKDKLWKQSDYYYGLLEETLLHIAQKPLEPELLYQIVNWSIKRKNSIIDKSFDDLGNINVSIVKETLWQTIKRKLFV